MDIICISPNFWKDKENIWRRRHYLMSCFSKKNRVLFVEPVLSFWQVLNDRIRLGQLFRYGFNIHKEKNELFVLSQYNFLPFERLIASMGIKLISRINEKINIKRVQCSLKKLDFNKPILWLYLTAKSKNFIGCCNEKMVVCDVFDRYTKYPRPSDSVIQQESLLLKKVDIIFAASRGIYEYCQSLNTNVHLVPNAVDAKIFKSTLGVVTIPRDVRHISHPILGYAGAIFEKIDFSLLEYVAKTKPQWSIVLIGPIKSISKENNKKIDSLKTYGNIFFLGLKQKDELPAYYKAIDIGLMPYVINEYTKGIFPLKLFEYLAWGKPVVSTNIPSVRELDGVVSIAKNPQEFVEHISRLLSQNNDEIIRKGQKVAKQNVWDFRIKQTTEIITSELQKRKSLQ